MTKIKYFCVEKHPDNNAPNDIYFGVEDNEEDFPDHILDLKNDFEQFISIIQSVFKDDSSLFDRYYSRAYELAELAFNSPKDQSKIAQNGLDRLKNEVVIDVGARIRSVLLFNFFKSAFIPLLVAIFIVFFGDKLLTAIDVFSGVTEGTYFISKLGLVAIGALAGSWISIATATRTISYKDIYPILNNNKGILARVMFIIIFSVSFAIIMISGVLTINLGGLDSTEITSSSSVALSFGFIIGFADKMFVEKFEAKLTKIKL